MRLSSRRASGEHAVLFWDGSRWAVRDLGSRNGTRVGGDRVPATRRVTLDAGAALTFGDEAERWTLEDAGPPAVSARSEATGEVRAADHGLLALPHADNPRVTLFEGRDGLWYVEVDGVARPAEDHEQVDADGPWILRIPPAGPGGAVPTTNGAESTRQDPTMLRFEVSSDEEHIALTLVRGAQRTSLSGRAHHELLLTLARARLRDRVAGLPPAEQGWMYVDDLIEMLKLDLKHFNVNVFRARQQLAQAGVGDVGALLERRPTTRQLRLGTDAIEVVQAAGARV